MNHGQHVITGFHGIEEFLRRKGKKTGTLYLARTGKRHDQLARLAGSAGLKIEQAEMEELDRIAPGADHRGVLLVLEQWESQASPSLEAFLRSHQEAAAVVLLLDEITDPHNYGAILRSADQFGVDLVITTARRSARDTDTVARTSAGASAYVSVAVVPNLARAVQSLKDAGFWVYGAEMNGSALQKTRLDGKIALVMGSEGKGLRRLVRESCDGFVSIPQQGHIDSLNVSVATGILLYEIRRQQNRLE